MDDDVGIRQRQTLLAVRQVRAQEIETTAPDNLDGVGRWLRPNLSMNLQGHPRLAQMAKAGQKVGSQQAGSARQQDGGVPQTSQIDAFADSHRIFGDNVLAHELVTAPARQAHFSL
jgi:hypothetical protein